jgi:DNA polymerase (family 10)
MLGHPSGRLLLARQGYRFDEKAVFEALAEHGVLLEHNCHPQRLDPDWDALKRAGAMGIKISLNPDAHAIEDFDYLGYGLTMARKAWLEPSQVVNCMSTGEISGFFRERKSKASGK